MAETKSIDPKKWVCVRRNYFNQFPEKTYYDPKIGRDRHYNKMYEPGDIIVFPTLPNKWWRPYGDGSDLKALLLSEMRKNGYRAEEHWSEAEVVRRHSQMLTDLEIKRVRTTHHIKD